MNIKWWLKNLTSLVDILAEIFHKHWGGDKIRIYSTFRWRILKSGPPYVGGDYPLLVSTTIFLGRPGPNYGRVTPPNKKSPPK